MIPANVSDKAAFFRITIKKIILLSLLSIHFFVFFACSSMEKQLDRIAPGLPETESLLNIIENRNNNLETFKGIGSFNLVHNKETSTARMAFMGRYPSSLRLEILSPTGQPMYSFSAHNNNIYFFSHFDNLFYTTRTYDANLKRLMSVQINVSDVIDLLSGRIPIKSYSKVRIERNHNENGWILILKKRWFGGRQKIYLDEKRTEILKFESYSFKGDLKYRAEIKNTVMVQNFKVPKKIILTDSKKTIFTLRIDAYNVNFKIEEEDRFILKPQEGMY